MKITKRQLRKIVKEAALNELFGGKEKKEKRAKATQELQKAAMDYINDFSSSKVGPFLKKGDDVRGPYNVKGRLDPEGEYYSQVIRQDLTDNDLAHGQRLDDEQHEEMKKHHEVLEGMMTAWESATGKRADNDDAPFDVRYVSKALAIPSLYLRSHGDEVNEGKKMKVTKRQLRRIIKETRPDYQGLPQSDIDYYDLADDYAMWSKENGHVTPVASSVMATYFLEKGLADDHEKHEALGKAFKVDHGDIMRDIQRQQLEKAAMMGESTTKITKRQLRQIIREAIAGVAVGPSKGSTFLDLTMRAIEDGDYRKAASYIMDSYMIDDIFPEDENNLMAALSSLPSARRTSADVEAVADEWLEGIRRADEKAAEEILSTRMGSYKGTTLPGGKKL